MKGLNAVDSGTLSTNPNGDIEPGDQAVCAGNGYVVEANNIGEMLIFNQNLHRLSGAIPSTPSWGSRAWMEQRRGRLVSTTPATGGTGSSPR